RLAVAEIKVLLQPGLDPRQSARDLARDEGLSAARRLVIEKDAVARVHLVALAVIDRHPVAVDLRRAVGAARIKRRVLALRHRLHEAVHLAAGGLIETGLRRGLVDGLEQTRRAA